MTAPVSRSLAADQAEERAVSLQRELSSSRRVGYLRRRTDPDSDQVTFVLKDVYDKTTYWIIAERGLDLTAFVDRYVSLGGETEEEGSDRQLRFAAERVTALDDREPATARATHVRPAALEAETARPIETHTELNGVQVAALTDGLPAPSDVVNPMQPPLSIEIDTGADGVVGQPFTGSMPGSPPAASAWRSPFGALGGTGCGGCDSCSPGRRCPKWEFYGDLLYIRARDAEVAYAVPFDGPVAPPGFNPRVQVGPVGVLDMDYQPAFRVGGGRIIDACTRISVEYTWYDSGTNNQTLRGSDPNYVVHSLVSHPSTSTAAQDFIQADGQYNITMNMFDVDMRRLFYNDCDLRVGWVLGVRAASQQQQMRFSFAGSGTETVTTDIDFTGAGVKFGLGGETRVSGPWLAYASFTGSMLPGSFSASFDQSQSFDPSVVKTSWKAGRIATVWDVELGVSRVSRSGNYRFNGGYVFSAWTNTVQTDEWIEAVHTNNFIGMASTMTFDGLVGRFEARF